MKAYEYDDGILPTIRFVTKDGNELREIHQSQNNSQHWDWFDLEP